MFERQQSDQQKAREVMKDGGVVIYWRPGCPYCEALDSKLGELGDHATWVNIWEDPQAEAHVKSLNDGNAVVPTVDTGDTHFVVADLVSRNKVKKLIQNTLDAGGEAKDGSPGTEPRYDGLHFSVWSPVESRY